MKPVKNTMGMFDLLKGLFIILTIFSHSSADFLHPWDVGDKGPWELLYSYVPYKLATYTMIPMFCIICGFWVRKKSMGECIKGQFRFLWKPYLLTALAISAGIVVKKLVIHGNIWEGLRYQALPYLLGACPGGNYFGIGMDSVGPIWFIVMYVFSGILLNAVLQEERVWGQVLSVAAMAAVGITLKEYRIPFCFQQSLICTLYMYIGYMMKKVKFLEKEIPAYWWVIGVAFLLFLAPFGDVDVSQNVWKNGLADVLGGVFGGVMLLVLVLPLNRLRGPISMGIRWLGRQVMPLCCIHTVFYTLLPRQMVAEYFGDRAALGILLVFLFFSVTAVGGCWLILLGKRRKSIKRKITEEV